MLTAIALLVRHDQCVYTTIALLVFVLALNFTGDRATQLPKWKALVVWWLGGLAIIALPLFLLWWRLGAIPEMFRQLVIFPFATYRKTSALPFPTFGAAKSLFDTAVVTLFYLPGIVQTIALIYLVQSLIRRGFGRGEAGLLFLLVWSALFYLQVMVRSDQNHLLMTLPPTLILSAYLWSMALISMANHCWARRISSVTLSVVVLSLLWSLRSMALPDLSNATETLALPRGGVRVAQPQVAATFVKALQSSVPPERSILALPHQPMFYFLCDRRNPTRWNYLWPGDQTSEDHQHLVEQAERDPPAVVLLGRENDLSASAPTITQYIEDKYVQTGNFGNLAIYLRRPN